MKHFKPILLLISSLILLASVPLLAATDTHVKDKAYIKNAMQKMDVAIQNKDLNGYLVFLHPDFINVNEAGVVTAKNKAQMGEEMSRLFTHATSIAVAPTTVTRFVFSKQGVTVYESGSLNMILMVSGQKSVVYAGGTYQDFWVKAGNSWLEKRSVAVSTKNTLNGRFVP